MTTILVSGLPGVGKTTALRAATDARPTLHVVSVGAAIRAAAAHVGASDDVRTQLTAAVTRSVVAHAKASIVEQLAELGNDIALLDSHTSTVGEFSVRLTPDTHQYLAAIRLAGVIMLRAPVDVILTRRGTDHRNPRLGDERDLAALDVLMMSSLASVATQSVVPMHVIDADASLDTVTTRLLAAVDDIVSWTPRS